MPQCKHTLNSHGRGMLLGGTEGVVRFKSCGRMLPSLASVRPCLLSPMQVLSPGATEDVNRTFRAALLNWASIRTYLLSPMQVPSPGATEKGQPPFGLQSVKGMTSPAPQTSAWQLCLGSPCRSGSGSSRACPTTASPLTMPSLSARPAAGLCSLTLRYAHCQ